MNKVNFANWFPFIAVLKAYNLDFLRGDLYAGLAVAAIALPQSMAYATIAGVSPIYGLYATILPVIIASLWGSSKYMIAGPTNAVAMILFSSMASLSIGGISVSTMPDDMKMLYVFAIALLAGVIQVGMGFCRLGNLVNYVSHSVMVAFTAGAAMLIGAGQLEPMLGIQYPDANNFFAHIWSTFQHIQSLHIWSLLVGVVTILCIITIRKLYPKVPFIFISVGLATFASWLFDLQAMGVSVVGEIPSGFPPMSIPSNLDIQTIRDLFFPALSIALLGAVEALAIGKVMASANNDKFGGNKELIAQGLGNIAAGLSSSIPGCGSFSRSAVNLRSGAKTSFAGVFSALYIIIFILFLLPLLEFLPMPALSGVLFVTVYEMVNKEGIRLCWVSTKADRYTLILTFVATLLLGLERALLIGVLFSLAYFILKISHSRVTLLNSNSPSLFNREWAKGCCELSVYMFEGALFFGAISELEEDLYAKDSSGCKVVLLDLDRIFWIDASGAHALEQFIERSKAKSIPVIIVASRSDIKNILSKTGLLNHLEEGFIVDTFSEGLKVAQDLMEKNPSCALT